VDRLAAWWAARTGGGVRAVVAVDGLLAVVLGGLAAQGSWDVATDRGMRLGVAGFGLVAVAAGGLVVRRVWPVAALAVSLGATLLYLASGYPYSPILQLSSVTAYSVGAWCSGRLSLAAVAAAVGVYVPYAWWAGGTPWPAFGVGPLAAVWLVLPWLVGMAVRAYRRVQARVADAERRGQVYQERLLIAREVHDVVGHSLAVINMQAGVALHVLDRRPERAVQALRAMRQASASALDELRATLGGPAPEASHRPGPLPDRRPAPGLARLPELMDAVSHDGLRAELVVEGQRRALSATVDLAAYRIVQESLTNVVRHAAADRATVRVRYEADTVSVTVTDDGRGPAVTDDAGRGLVGMRERAVTVGGAFSAGAGVHGGFEVRAVLPLTGMGGGTSTPG
jgi:signal transduction histidine kinase